MRGSPPLRFLALVLGGWAAMRTAVVAPPWLPAAADATAAPAEARPSARAVPPRVWRRSAARQPLRPGLEAPARPRTGTGGALRPFPKLPAPLEAPVAPAWRGLESVPAPVPGPQRPAGAAPAAGPSGAAPGRWSLSAWAFVRRGGSGALAAGGLLGGSQAGARLGYRLNRDPARPLAVSLRLAAPLRRGSGGEAALGLDWRPSRRIPLHLLAERRQALGGEGRSAFGLTLHGGISEAPLGRLRLDAYAQAGIVGLRSRDPFGDGALRVSLPLGSRIKAGAGAWAAAQPGVARLDLGPQAVFRLPVAGRPVTLAADWRLRVAGKADPAGGPTITLATDF